MYLNFHAFLKKRNIKVMKEKENLNVSRSLIWSHCTRENNKVLPSRSAPSSTSPMTSDPAVESSWYRESVLMPNALFTIPCVGLLLEAKKQKESCYLATFKLKYLSWKY